MDGYLFDPIEFTDHKLREIMEKKHMPTGRPQN